MNIKFDLPARMLADCNIPPIAVVVYGILCDAAIPTAGNDHVWTDISNATILSLFGGNISRCTIARAMNDLAAAGYIKRTVVTSRGQQNIRVIEILGGRP